MGPGTIVCCFSNHLCTFCLNLMGSNQRPIDRKFSTLLQVYYASSHISWDTPQSNVEWDHPPNMTIVFICDAHYSIKSTYVKEYLLLSCASVPIIDANTIWTCKRQSISSINPVWVIWLIYWRQSIIPVDNSTTELTVWVGPCSIHIKTRPNKAIPCQFSTCAYSFSLTVHCQWKKIVCDMAAPCPVACITTSPDIVWHIGSFFCYFKCKHCKSPEDYIFVVNHLFMLYPILVYIYQTHRRQLNCKMVGINISLMPSPENHITFCI